MNSNIIQLASQNDCTGCSACVNICPKSCISMIEDKEGFLQPKIDTEVCIECHKCEKTCPILNKAQISQDYETKVYAVINPDDEIRMSSSSGGVFYALAKWVIEQGGVVFGARWDDNWEVIHDYTEELNGVKKFMTSKYVQSCIGNTFKQTKQFLQQDRWVLFSGTPCQLGGLRAYLEKDYEKLLQVDLICHGVPSPGVWRQYLKENIEDDTILDINMRDKNNGWNDFQLFTTTTTTTTRVRQIDNPFFRGFLYNIYLRNSCYNCQYKTQCRNVDITLADYWGVKSKEPSFFDDKGTSAVFVHSAKGEKILSELKALRIKQQNINDVIENNQSMICSVQLNHLRRKDYFYSFVRKGFNKSISYIDKDRLYVRVLKKIKKLIQE